MNIIKFCLLGALAANLVAAAHGTDRLFTYSYEPETMPQGAWEIEQWLTARLGRNAAVGRRDYRRFDLRQELEYGLTDSYTLSLYVNTKQQSYRDPAAGADYSRFIWQGISLENKILLLNPAEHAVGLSLYFEPRISHEAAAFEQKLILGQRHGAWKWALNLTHETEWEDRFRNRVGELEASLGVARKISRRWRMGIEARNHYQLPRYARWENMAVYAGPVLSCHREKWWAALTVMPQLYGANFAANPDRVNRLDLAGHERWNIRLIFGFGF